MLLTNHQKLVQEALELLGGARLDQLAALLCPAFCAGKPEIAPRIAETTVRQLRLRNMELWQEDDLVFLPGRRPGPEVLEAIDVMLELSGGTPLSYGVGRPPILLRFSVQEQKVRLFAVVLSGADLIGTELRYTEKIIRLFDGQGRMRRLPVSNKQFCAVRQSDGTHRFFAVDGQA